MKKILSILFAVLFMSLSYSYAQPATAAQTEVESKTELSADEQGSNATPAEVTETASPEQTPSDKESVAKGKRTKREKSKSESGESSPLPLVSLILSVVSLAAVGYLFMSTKKVSELAKDFEKYKSEKHTYFKSLETKINDATANARQSKSNTDDARVAALEAKVKELEQKLATPVPVASPVVEHKPAAYVPVTYYASYDMNINGVNADKLKSSKTESSVLRLVTTSDTTASVTLVDDLDKTQLARLFDSPCTNVDGNTQSFSKVELIKSGVMILDSDEWTFTEPIRIKLV